MHTLTKLWLLTVLLVGSVAVSADAVTDKRILVDAYLAVWSEQDPNKRQAQLAQLFVVDGVHQSPTTHSVGYEAIGEEIEAFQQRFPGASVTATNLLMTKNHLVFNFSLTDAAGNPIVSGIDYVKLSVNGSKIEKVVGFY
ncbi:nuclear transport factor 2 family protein [Gilvimarinus sp. SDUM040013]|uniref:Nuclear transport factor 2 family protein n=1 Tax=Gilvimarinus gilvus TaxID=3058038 RepID=A0ABU4S168_9GAMM|nr:nuclear transport factor 2 family protein [Gilvimarinus sp. SDUM040013]MDO3388708.1 nuclear transport factor 2 family protein [Gilvimarinus sp. SDUM040013]MDX6849603.1 nuclear transport factor 2 family protein [Gilvimarinus sp. SDUM040013]